MKVEINIWAIDAYDAPNEVEFSMDNPWFSGRAAVCTLSREEMLATKLRALLQRNKGRDLNVLAHAIVVIEGFQHQTRGRMSGALPANGGTADVAGGGRGTDVCKAAETWPPDRSPSVAVNRRRDGVVRTKDQGHVRQGLFRTGRSSAGRTVGQDQGNESSF